MGNRWYGAAMDTNVARRIYKNKSDKVCGTGGGGGVCVYMYVCERMRTRSRARTLRVLTCF